MFPSRDVDRIFSTNNRLSAEGLEYSYNVSSMGYYGCTMTRSSNRALTRFLTIAKMGALPGCGGAPSMSIRVWPIRILKIGGVSEGRRFVGVRSFPVLPFPHSYHPVDPQICWQHIIRHL